MAHLTEVDNFHPKIWQVDLSTPAIGGIPIFTEDDYGNITPVGGHDNIQSTLLADRTRNLYNRLLTIENQLLNNRLTAIENNGVGELVRMTYFPTDLATLPDYAFSGVLWFRGQTISRTTYARLFAKVQPQLSVSGLYGVGDGSTTFTLADLRGEFDRSWDGGRGVDSLRGFGTWQDYATARPKTTNPSGVGDNGLPQPLSKVDNPSQVAFVRVGKLGEAVTHIETDSSRGAVGDGAEIDLENPVSGDAETRPRNRAFLWCVRY